MLRSAPPLEIPVPFKVKASAPTAIPPWISKAAPLVTEVLAAVVPSAVAVLNVYVRRRLRLLRRCRCSRRKVSPFQLVVMCNAIPEPARMALTEPLCISI